MGRTDQARDSIKTFGEMLKHLRRRARLTQRELGIAVGYSESQITRLENGQRSPDPDIVEAKFIEALGLKLDSDSAREFVALARIASAAVTLTSDSFPLHDATTQHNLPVQLTRFIGREHEVAEVMDLFHTHRLVTLTGSGGVGKTRLAIEVGRNSLGKRRDGVWFVDLASLTDSEPLTNTVASLFGLQTMSRSALTVLTEYLQERQTLLILDNCEHVIDACARLASELLQACPRLQVLTTSREALNIPGEVTWRVPPLEMDKAMQLFAERASAVNSSFVVTPANSDWVAHICRRLDEIPLAIELAAARIRAFSVEDLAARMDDIFRLLTGGSRTALPRHQTLRAAIEWSYHLLPEEERTLLRDLSVFAGGWTLDAAEAIHGAGAIEYLDQLVNKSLVIATIDDTTGKTRYRLLETIRQYAVDVATHSSADATHLNVIRDRHLAYYADLAQAGLMRFESGMWLWIWSAVVAAELDNTRAALGWAAHIGAWQLGWQLISGALGVWTTLGHGNELTHWMETIVLSNPSTATATRCSVLTMMGRVNYDKGDAVSGLENYRAASALAHQLNAEDLIMEADQYLGFLSPDNTLAVILLTSVLQLARKIGHKDRVSWALSQFSTRLYMMGNTDEALTAQTESIQLARETHDPGIVAVSLVYMSHITMLRGEPALARLMIEEGMLLAQQRGMPKTLGMLLADLAEVGLQMKDVALVKQSLKEHIPLHHRMDSLERVAQGLASAAGLAHLQDQPLHAVRLLGAASTIRRDHHTQGIFELELFAEYEQRVPMLRDALPTADFETAWAEGQKLSLNQAITEALAV